MKQIVGAVAALLLSGCATTVPSFGPRGEVPQARWIREIELVTHVKCELQQALLLVDSEQRRNAQQLNRGHDVDWLKDWGATVNLKLVVNEKTTFSPSLALVHPLQNAIETFPVNGNVTVQRSRSLGFGATAINEASRTETIAFFYSFAQLLGSEAAIPPPVLGGPGQCGSTGGMSRNNDLKIRDFLRSKLFLSQVGGVLQRKEGTSPFSVFTYQIGFIVTSSATVSPTWKLLPLQINPGGALYNGQRIRTHELILTLGPVKKDDKGATIGPSDAARDANLAAMIGRAVAAAIDNQE